VLDEAAAQMAADTGGTVRTFAVDIRDAQAVDAMVDELFATGGSTAWSTTRPATSSARPRR
jgi:short-subunit dehydrogenase